MSYTYTSLEDGQTIVTDEPREDLDELARWVRSDATASTEQGPLVTPPNIEPVAGHANLSPVTGGVPPLTSASAGIADPADTLTPEEAKQAAEEALNAAQAPEPAIGTIPTAMELASTPPAIVTDASGTVHGDGKTIPTLPVVGEPVPGPFEVLKFLKGDDNAKGELVDRKFDTLEDASAFADEQSVSDPLYSYTAVPKPADDGAQG